MEGALFKPKTDKSPIALAPKLAKKKKTNRMSIKVNVGRNLSSTYGKK